MIIQMVLVFTCDKRYVDWLHCMWGKVVLNFREVGANLGADRAVKCAELLFIVLLSRDTCIIVLLSRDTCIIITWHVYYCIIIVSQKSEKYWNGIVRKTDSSARKQPRLKVLFLDIPIVSSSNIQ